MRVVVATVVVMVLLFVGYFVIGFAPMGDPDNPIVVKNAYARSNGRNATAGAAFMTIHNQSGQADRLISAATDLAAKTELHTHIEGADGVMMMRRIDGGIDVPWNAEATLERGGDHVMLMGLSRCLNEGETIKMVLTFEKAGAIAVDVLVNNSK